MEYDVCVILVVYNPVESQLCDLLLSLKYQVKKFYIFDNSIDSNVTLNKEMFQGLKYEIFSNSRNVGIAQAQNKLLFEALQNRHEYALFTDQDSIYPKGYILELIKSTSQIENLVAICPNWRSKNSFGTKHDSYQYIIDSTGKLKLIGELDNVIFVSHAISSGMILNLNLLPNVGFMSEELFIDWVDNEWCWRAISRGYKIALVPWVEIDHYLGDFQVKKFGRLFVKRKPFRNYYIIRNAIYLSLYGDLNRNFKLYLFKKTIHHILFALLTSDRKIIEMRYISKAIYDAISKKMGKAFFKENKY